jgi:hypothetical protein
MSFPALNGNLIKLEFFNFLKLKDNTNMIIHFLLTAFAGIAYGFLLYFSKVYGILSHKPIHDIALTIFRYALLLSILFYLATKVESNSILLIILFVSSYLSTLAILVYKR